MIIINANAYMDPLMGETLNHNVLTVEGERNLTRGLYEVNERLTEIGYALKMPPENGELSNPPQSVEYISRLTAHSNGYGKEVDFLKARRRDIIDELVKYNQRFVWSIAKKYKTTGVPVEDLMQAGNMGLHRAILKFDYKRGYKLSTYAYRAVRYAILRVIKEHSKQRGVMFTDLTDDADVLIDETTPNPKAPLPPMEAERMEDMEGISDMLSGLDEREEDVLIHRYGLWGNEKRTLEKVGKNLGVSKEMVRQIQNKGIGKLRNMVVV